MFSTPILVGHVTGYDITSTYQMRNSSILELVTATAEVTPAVLVVALVCL